MKDLWWVVWIPVVAIVVALCVSVAIADTTDCWLGECKIVCDGKTCRQECKEFCRE